LFGHIKSYFLKNKVVLSSCLGHKNVLSDKAAKLESLQCAINTHNFHCMRGVRCEINTRSLCIGASTKKTGFVLQSV